MNSTVVNKKIDGIGIIVSIICIIHCIGLPLLVSFAPSITVMLEKEWIHLSLLAFLFPIAILAFINGAKIHSNKKPLYIGLVGVLFLGSALLFEDFEAFNLEGTLTFIGSFFLILAHILNLKFKNNTLKHT